MKKISSKKITRASPSSPLLLKLAFYRRPALVVARRLLGKFLVRQIGRKKIRRMITETEAYIGPHDLASHSSKGRTSRTAVMFEPGGRWYVYFVYGKHYLLNVVTDGRDYPSAVLLRAVEGINGPGRLTKYFKIDKKLNGQSAAKKSGLWIEDQRMKIKFWRIVRGKRIGVDYVGPQWSAKPYRFILSRRSDRSAAAEKILGKIQSKSHR